MTKELTKGSPFRLIFSFMLPVLIGNINSDGGAEQLYGGEPCAVRQNLPKEPALLARNSY